MIFYKTLKDIQFYLFSSTGCWTVKAHLAMMKTQYPIYY